MQTYWLDADVYIQAKNGPYRFHSVPQFWDFLSQQINADRIRSPKLVYDEILEGNDELAKWFEARADLGLRVIADRVVADNYRKIADHVYTSHSHHQSAKFLKGGDGWVIAHAMAEQGVVVTQESLRSVKSKVKIPTVCRHFSVRCQNTYEMLEVLNFKA